MTNNSKRYLFKFTGKDQHGNHFNGKAGVSGESEEEARRKLIAELYSDHKYINKIKRYRRKTA